MINIQLNNKNYDFPETWAELTIGKYQECMSMINLEESMDKTLHILSSISGILLDELYDLPYTTYSQLSSIVSKLFNLKEDKPKFDLTIDGVKYKMISEISKMTTAEFIDLDTLINDQENAVSNLHILMAILYRPVDKKGKITKYRSQEVEERAIIFKEKMTCDYALSALFFSLVLGEQFTLSMKVYSDQVVKEMKTQKMSENPLKSDGVGM